MSMYNLFIFHKFVYIQYMFQYVVRNDQDKISCVINKINGYHNGNELYKLKIVETCSKYKTSIYRQ